MVLAGASTSFEQRCQSFQLGFFDFCSLDVLWMFVFHFLFSLSRREATHTQKRLLQQNPQPKDNVFLLPCCRRSSPN